VFWFGLVLSVLAALTGVGSLRKLLKAALPAADDVALDVLRVVLIVTGACIAAASYQTERRQKEQLAVELREIRADAASEDYVAASSDVERAVTSGLNLAFVSLPSKERKEIIVVVDVEGGDRNRELVGAEILRLLSAARVPSRRASSLFLRGSRRVTPAAVLSYDLLMRSFAESFLKALELRFDTASIERDETGSGGKIQLMLGGRPKFLQSGLVTFR